GGGKGLGGEGEVGDDAEVAPPAPQRPEQIRVLLFAGHDEVAVGGDHITASEPVDGEAELAHQVTEPSPQGQAADPGVADDPAGGGQPEGLAFPIKMGVEATSL